MGLPPFACQVVLCATVVIAAVFDVRQRRIPNWLVLAALISGLALNTFLFEWPGLRMSLLGILLAFLIYFPLYLLRGMGAGDVKLMAAVGALVGPANWIGIFVITSILGGIAAVILLVSRGRLAAALGNIGFLFYQATRFRPPFAREELDLRSDKSLKLPHAAVIACGVAAFLGAAYTWAPK
jgi:prepilin peptidase CpaA